MAEEEIAHDIDRPDGERLNTEFGHQLNSDVKG
jgi:hypothetical protein